MRQYDKAVDGFTAVIKLDPTSMKPYFYRADLLLNLGKLEEAIKDHSRAIERNPTFLAAYMNRAVACKKKGLRDLAITDLIHVVASALPLRSR